MSRVRWDTGPRYVQSEVFQLRVYQIPEFNNKSNNNDIWGGNYLTLEKMDRNVPRKYTCPRMDNKLLTS